MQFNLEDVLNKNGELIVQDFKNVMSSKNLDNTGGTSKSLKSKVSGSSLSILGDRHFQQLNFGRKPGKFAPVKKIQDWVRTKLGISDLKEIKSIGFLVNRKIAKKGTTIFNNRAKGIELDKREEFGTKLIQKSVTNLIQITISSNISEQLRLNRTIK